jgi:hypothetical protein
MTPIFNGDWSELIMFGVLFLSAKYTWNYISDAVGFVIRMLPVVGIFLWIVQKYGGDVGLVYSRIMQMIQKYGGDIGVIYSKVMEAIQSFRALRYTGPEP